jgi:3-methylcrotonyl-CoA carboxylase beta subunit
MDLEFNKNEDQLKQLCFQLKMKAKSTQLGGGEKKIEAQHQKGKLTARERIDYLIDKDSEFWKLVYLLAMVCIRILAVAPQGVLLQD